MNRTGCARLLLTCFSVTAAWAQHPLGTQPPDFTCDTTLPGSWGDDWTLSDHRGKVVMLNFGATW
ncbi:MAG: hypothetical protein KC518_00120 [Candidatus Cloacimonetes bacterium]|nr:hypothetical protein [Candidatus Cloacimonadota bacterium]MCA9786216.1 hypothetical protein [Candidatus Cloacimonadota bacterium]